MKILKRFDLKDWEFRELKSAPLTEKELAEMYAHTKSYEALFSRRSTQLKARSIDVNNLTELDYKKLLLTHYSFLKRPVFLTDELIFVGNDKQTVGNLEQFINA